MSDVVKAALRLGIVTVARYQAMVGAHYLNGTVGNTPGNADGYRNRTLKHIRDSSYDKLGIHAAEWSGERCKGRCDKVGGCALPATQATKDAVKKYIADNTAKGLDPDFWPPFDRGCYPRRKHGKDSSAIYIGESCLGKRHFDCIGLINWAIGVVLAKQPTYSIKQWDKGGGGMAKTMDPPHVSDLQNADILIRLNDHGHIGFATASGEVIHASGSEVGVIVSEYRREKWTKLARLKDSYLKVG